jgi:hypothetical protein
MRKPFAVITPEGNRDGSGLIEIQSKMSMGRSQNEERLKRPPAAADTLTTL